jgi:hypothetical protein
MQLHTRIDRGSLVYFKESRWYAWACLYRQNRNTVFGLADRRDIPSAEDCTATRLNEIIEVLIFDKE